MTSVEYAITSVLAAINVLRVCSRPLLFSFHPARIAGELAAVMGRTKTYQCVVCNLSFNRKSHLDEHVKTRKHWRAFELRQRREQGVDREEVGAHDSHWEQPFGGHDVDFDMPAGPAVDQERADSASAPESDTFPVRSPRLLPRLTPADHADQADDVSDVSTPPSPVDEDGNLLYDGLDDERSVSDSDATMGEDTPSAESDTASTTSSDGASMPESFLPHGSQRKGTLYVSSGRRFLTLRQMDMTTADGIHSIAFRSSSW